MSKVNEIKQKLEEAGVRYWANDNISEVLQKGDKEALIEEAIPAFENVLQTLLIDTKTDPNSQDTARRMAKMYINEIMSGRYGDYIKWNKVNVTIPKEKSIQSLTLEESIDLIEAKRKK